jgi:oligoribonuclease NrnB/cAMP/cGMP phosphodiesterase (DHH superfamily)
MKPLIIYHANCTDGLTAAWVILRAIGDADTHAANYGTEPPDVTGRGVIIVDFSYKRPVMLDLCRKAAWVKVLDHHKTAEADLDGLVYELQADKCAVEILFDMTRSGARLAWDTYVVPDINAVPLVLQHAEWLVNYVQDRDLWKWELADSRLVSAAIESYPRTFEAWDELAARQWYDLVAEGRTIERYRRRCIESAIALARPAKIGGYTVQCANVSEMRFGSDTAGELAAGKEFGAYFFHRSDGIVQFGLRSDPNGVDVSEIAALYGGGGHKHAAGFQVALRDLGEILR